jgi:3-hydroxyisobutyrate dehydrogenase-like beta-hydroxyacid dehydrogenase
MKAGFIGMGDIGLPMAKNVVKKGFETYVTGHVRRQPIEEMVAKHIQGGSGGSFIATNYEWIKTMWTDPPPPTYYVGAKDMSHVLDIGLELRQPCPFTALACELLKGPPPKIFKSADG